MEQIQYKLTAAAKILGISPWTLRRLVYAGKVPHSKTTKGRIFISAAWLEATRVRLEQGIPFDQT